MLLVVAAVVLLSFLVWYFLRRNRFDAAYFTSTLVGIHWGWFALACAAALGTYFVRALRWRVFLEPLPSRASLWELTKATAVGFTAITLLGRAGEFVRPYLIARTAGVSVPSQLAALFLERIYDLLAALLVFGIGLSQVDRANATVGPGLRWALETGGVVVVALSGVSILLLVGSKYYTYQIQHIGIRASRLLPGGLAARAAAMIEAGLAGLASARSGNAMVRVAAYTVVEWVLIVMTAAGVIHSFGDRLTLSFPDIIIFTGFLAFGAIVQIPGVGGGVQVVTVLVLTELFGSPLEVATGVALVLWIPTFVIIVPIGLLLGVRDGIRWSSFARMKQEVA